MACGRRRQWGRSVRGGLREDPRPRDCFLGRFTMARRNDKGVGVLVSFGVGLSSRDQASFVECGVLDSGHEYHR